MSDMATHNVRKRKADDEHPTPHDVSTGASRLIKKLNVGGNSNELVEDVSQLARSGESEALSLSQGNKPGTSDDEASKSASMNGQDGDTEDDNHESEYLTNEEDCLDFSEEDSGDDYDDEAEDIIERDIEEHEKAILGDPERLVKLRLSVSLEDKEFELWLENIRVSCTYDGEEIGSALGRYIRREQIRTHFWQHMEEPSKDMADIAFGLFDKYGYLKQKFKDHPLQRGTGVWGEELDYGPLFFIERAEVTNKEWRRKGLGKAMVNLLIQKAEKKSEPEPMSPRAARFSENLYPNQNLEKYSRLHTVVLPGWLTKDVEAEYNGKSLQEKWAINNRAEDSAVAFCRSVGFRRIGASNFLGFSSDPKHKSHAISTANDFDLPLESPNPEMWNSDEDDDVSFASRYQRREGRRLERLKQTLPLHHAAVTLADLECLEYYKAFGRQDDASWSQADRLGNNLLHVLACQVKPLSTKWLMENFDVRNSLSSARNREGYTPLEALQDQLETGRTKLEINGFTFDRSAKFCGFPPEAVDCLSFLMHLDIQELSNTSRQRLTFGCTCGACLEGFISPRMKLALLFQAETSYDLLIDDVADGATWCLSNDFYLVHVDPDLRQNFSTNKSYRIGFANIFSFVADCLRSNTVPRMDNVLLEIQNGPYEWPPVTRSYLQRRGSIEGKIEPVLRILFDRAQDEDEKAGDGEFENVMSDELSGLRACRNDHEFGFVAQGCGLPFEDSF